MFKDMLKTQAGVHQLVRAKRRSRTCGAGAVLIMLEVVMPKIGLKTAKASFRTPKTLPQQFLKEEVR
jgi:hypothetical protein